MENSEVITDKKGFLSAAKGKGAALWDRFSHSEYLYLIAAFFLPFTILLGAYACLGTHPFGNGTVLTLDLQAQYIYYYEEIRRLLTEGGSWLYSWKRTLGGEFMGIVAYYGASPFNLIFALFPKDRIADAMMVIQLCKVGSMGVTFGYYLHKTRFVSQMHTLAFSSMYALCAYSVVQLCNPMWLDAMVLLPLLILGVERLIEKKAFILYTVALTLVFITNYYIGYMVGIFTFFYFVYYYVLKRETLVPPTAEKKPFFRSYGFWTFMRFGFFTVVSLLLAAFMLVAGYYSLTFGKTGFSNPDFSFSLRFDFLDLFVKLLPGSYDSVRPTGLPMIYSGTLSLIAIPLFYLSPAISKRYKACASLLLAVLVFSFCINTADLVWHGFSAPNWLNYRYSFVFSFFLIVIAYDTVKDLGRMNFVHVGTTCAILGVLVMIVQKLDYVFPQDTKDNALDDSTCILISLLFLAAFAIVLHLLHGGKNKEFASFVMAALVCVEMFASTIITLSEVQYDVGTVKYDNVVKGSTEEYNSYRGAIFRSRDVVNEILEKDDSFYRMESTVYRRAGGVNEPMAFGFNGISHSTSTLNASVIKLLGTLGYSSQSHWTKYIGGTPLTDSLLGIKYVVTENDTLDPRLYTVAASGDEYYRTIPSKDTIYVMQNTKALPIAYGVSPSLLTYMGGEVNGTITGLDYQNRLMLEMLDGTGFQSSVFKGISSTIDYENCKMGMTYTHPTRYTDENGEQQVHDTPYYTFDNATDGAKVIFHLTAPSTGKIYFHFPADNFQKTVDIYVNNTFLTSYFDSENCGIKELGEFTKGDKIKVELRMKKDAVYISRESNYYFYSIDYEAMSEALSTLEDCGMYVEEHGNASLSGEITLTAEQSVVFTTIPYDTGWHVYVDGKEVEYQRVLGSLIAFEAGEGFHTLSFRYMPRCYVIGFAAVAVGVVLFAFFIVLTKVKKVKDAVFGKLSFLSLFLDDGKDEEKPDDGSEDTALNS